MAETVFTALADGRNTGRAALGLVLMTSVGRRWIISSSLVFVAAMLLLPWVGPGLLDIDRILHRQAPDFGILVQLRISRTLLALFAGGALSLGGSLFQAMLRDALATPYTLGVSTGSALGAVAVLSAGGQTLLGMPAIWIGSLTGAMVVLFLVIGSSVEQRQLSAFSLLLTGIAVNSVCLALIVLMQSLAGVSRSFSISRWLIGSVDSTSYPPLLAYMAAVAAMACIVIPQAKSWNLLAVGEQWAATRGVKVSRLMLTGYFCGSILTAATVTLTGPIGFIGLIVPHLVRSRVTSDHRVLMPCSFLLGGVLLASCDSLGRVLLAPAEIPAGAIMAVLGGPYLVWLVRHRV
jgi:iron complex transport system permease protein